MLTANTVLTATPLDEAIRQCFELMKSEIRAEVRAALDQKAAEKLISGAEACKIFNPKISIVTLNKWVASGRITAHRMGGRIYYKASEILEAGMTIKKYKK